MYRNIIDKQLEEICLGIKECGDMETVLKFLREIFTRPELEDLALRWRLLKMLHNGIPQRKIASELGISLCKITRGAKLVRDSKSVVNSLIRKYI
ncbi:MAG TPA: Trp family transcriptional regulator [Chitinispirillaceae bacterium]|nr:Trp family transcriptional regulator [Chitinispirillaceae bacterium]